jgi:hypothetical protein
MSSTDETTKAAEVADGNGVDADAEAEEVIECERGRISLWLAVF